jgi:hypothetical protein
MSLNAVFYEFEINKHNLTHVVEDLEITQKSAQVSSVVDNLLGLIETNPTTYAKIEVRGRHGLKIRLSKRLTAERLSHSIEGMHAFIHPSSEGYIALEDFKTYFESSLKCHNILSSAMINWIGNTLMRTPCAARPSQSSSLRAGTARAS